MRPVATDVARSVVFVSVCVLGTRVSCPITLCRLGSWLMWAERKHVSSDIGRVLPHHSTVTTCQGSSRLSGAAELSLYHYSCIRWESRSDESIRSREGWQVGDVIFLQNCFETCYRLQLANFVCVHSAQKYIISYLILGLVFSDCVTFIRDAIFSVQISQGRNKTRPKWSVKNSSVSDNAKCGQNGKITRHLKRHFLLFRAK